MYITRYSADPQNTVDYIKANLEFIRNVTSFEVYFNDEDIPEIYRNVPDVYVSEGKRENQNRNYTLILRDDENEREIWLSGANCGYSGSGPGATQKILHLLGITFDYERITEEEKIIEKNLVSHHDLNVVVYRPTDMFDDLIDIVLKIRMTFQTASKKYRAKSALEQIGYIQPLSNLRVDNEMVDDINAYYFRDIPYSIKGKMEDYSTYYALSLNGPYSKLDDNTIKEIIENIRYTH